MGLDTLKKMPRTPGQVLGPVFFLVGIVILAWTIPVAGPPVHIGSSQASASFSTSDFPASRLHDYSTFESMSVNNQWLLPDGTAGWVDLKFSYPSQVADLFVLNTRNRDYGDRQAVLIKAILVRDGEVAWEKEIQLRPYPKWTRIPVKGSGLVDQLTIEVLEYEGLGGGLNEVRIRAANPAGLAGTVIGKSCFILLWSLPALLFLRVLRGSPDWLKWLGFAGLALVLYTMFWQFLQRPSFPYGHEFATHKERVAVYLAHFLQGDFLPVWSSSSVLGFGSPFPLYYHRLFYYVAAPAYLVTGSAKASALYAVGVFSMISVSGVVLFLRKSGTGAACALLLALCLPLLNYSYFNWTVRQAFSEYAAMCLLPWIFLWCKFVIDGANPYRILVSGSVLFPLLYFTHSLIFFLAAVPVLGSAAVWIYKDAADRKAAMVLLMAIGAVFFIVTGPLVILQLQLVDNLNFQSVIRQYNPLEQFVPLRDYLFNPNPLWGKDFVNVQLNFPLVGSVFCLLIYLLIRHHRKGWEGFGRQGGIFLLLSLAWYSFLQTRLASPVYEFVPGFAYVQFPWRGVAYITVLLVLLLGPILQALRKHEHTDTPIDTIAGLLIFLLVITFTPFQKTITREWYDGHFYESIPPAETGSYAFDHKDYWPVMEGIEAGAAYNHMAALQPRASTKSWSGDGYEIHRLDPHLYEDMLYEYELRVDRHTTITLPTCHSGLEVVETREPGGPWRRIETFRTARDFRVQFECDPGEYELRLQLPGLLF